jgi:hypothetical protein
LLDIIILCLIIYLDYFWCIKYQYIYIYIKIGKEKGKRKKEKGFPQLARPGGGGEFGPAERGRAGRRPTWPASGGTTRGRCRGRGPTCQREGEGTALGWGDRGGEPVGARPPVRSTVVFRWGLGSVTTGWWQSMGGGRGLWWWCQFRWRALGTVGPRRGGGRPRWCDRR